MRNRVPQRASACWRFRLLSSVALYAMMTNTMAPLAMAGRTAAANDGNTTTPIKHVIVIIGENRTFDHLFATYKPVNKGEKVLNLLSEGIVKANGLPGPNYAAATQSQAQDTTTYQLSPGVKSPYTTLPPPLAGGGYTQTIGGQTVDGQPPFLNIPDAMTDRERVADQLLSVSDHGSRSPRRSSASRIRASCMTARTSTTCRRARTRSPRGRLQRLRREPGPPLLPDVAAARLQRAGGFRRCPNDLFPWVEATVGAGSNGKPPPADFTYKEGATSMGFYNVQQGDVPYFKQLADTYSMSDNYHQSVNGGTGANHIMLGTGDAIWFSDGNGNPLMPPHNQMVARGNRQRRRCRRDRKPQPVEPSTNNWYTQDGYGGGSYGSPSYGGGSYTDCADTSQPGVPAILNYLNALKVKPNCQSRALLPAQQLQSRLLRRRHQRLRRQHQPPTPISKPCSRCRRRASQTSATPCWQSRSRSPISATSSMPTSPIRCSTTSVQTITYCNICNFFQYSTSIMTNAPVRQVALKDTIDLYNDLQSGNLPAVSFVKPDGYLDGHPASSKVESARRLCQKDRRPDQGQPDAVGEHGDLHHHGRRRWIL